jgi:hypothetical protein
LPQKNARIRARDIETKRLIRLISGSVTVFPFCGLGLSAAFAFMTEKCSQKGLKK